MESAPLPRIDIPDYNNYQPDQELFKLRKRLGDLIRMGAATPETFQQAMMQMWQETEKRRQTCLQQAEEHLRKYHALVAQSHGFSSMASIAFSVVNGFVMIEERRTQELAEREKEKEVERAEAQAEVPEEEVKVNGHGEAFEGQPEERTSGGRRKKS